MMGKKVSPSQKVGRKRGEGITWGQLCAVALIAGIGFTMSLFVTDLAFQCPEMRYVAKLSILFTSALAGILALTTTQHYVALATMAFTTSLGRFCCVHILYRLSDLLVYGYDPGSRHIKGPGKKSRCRSDLRCICYGLAWSFVALGSV